jgi:lipopolysaccharide export system permease protein
MLRGTGCGTTGKVMRTQILDRYILKNHIGPYLFGLSIITFVFIMDFIFKYLDLFIGKGVNFFVVLEFFILSLGHMFALIIPMAVMPATLMAFGQLAAENEITAMKASGISLYRMILPVVAAAAILSGLLVYYNNVILPESNHRLLNLMIDIGKMRPTLEIKENVVSDAIKGYTILVREKNDKTGEIRDIQIRESRQGGIPTFIIAARGRMSFRDEENVLRFELQDGEIHEMPDPNDITTYRRTSFKNFVLNIQDSDRSLQRTERTHRGDREMSAGMMKEKIMEIEGKIESAKEYMHETAAKKIVSKLETVAPEAGKLMPEKRSAAPIESGAKPLPERSSKPGDAEFQVLQLLDNETHNIIEMYTSQIYRYGVEIHKKYSIPFSCIVFVLLGAPLAIRSGKKGMTMSIGFSILFFLVYYIFLISGEKLADRRLVVPWLSMWLPNIILSAVALVLVHRTVKEAKTINWEKLNILKRFNRG